MTRKEWDKKNGFMVRICCETCTHACANGTRCDLINDDCDVGDGGWDETDEIFATQSVCNRWESPFKIWEKNNWK